MTSIVLKAAVEDLRLVLPEGRVLRGRVVDGAARPLVGATIEAASPSSDSRKRFQWRTKTDADGRFAWDRAPATEEYAVNAKGFVTRSRVKLNADGTEQTIHLIQSGPPAIRRQGEMRVRVRRRATRPTRSD